MHIKNESKYFHKLSRIILYFRSQIMTAVPVSSLQSVVTCPSLACSENDDDITELLKVTFSIFKSMNQMIDAFPSSNVYLAVH